MSQGAFLGTSDFAATVLAHLAASDHRPALVVTLPDRKRGRGRRLQASPVAEAAEQLGIGVLKSANVNEDEDREKILGAGGEWASICAFGQIIKEPLLGEMPMLNVHPSLLPRWRGAAPIERSIMAGDQETGVCVMRLVAGLDSGPVALRRSLPIEVDEDFGRLSGRLAELGGELLVEALDLAASGRIEWSEQSEDGLTYAEKIESRRAPDRPGNSGLPGQRSDPRPEPAHRGLHRARRRRATRRALGKAGRRRRAARTRARACSRSTKAGSSSAAPTALSNC